MREKNFVFFCLVILVIAHKSNAVQLRLIDHFGGVTDKSYFDIDAIETKIIKVNETYNRIALHYVVMKDFPKDVMMNVKITKYTDDINSGTLIGTYDLAVCDQKEPLHKYLPIFVVKLTKGGKCITKGAYDFYDSGQFRFDLLIKPEVLTSNSKYATSHTFYHKNESGDILNIRETWIISEVVKTSNSDSESVSKESD